MKENYQKVEKFGKVNIKNDKNEFVLKKWRDEIKELPGGLLLARNGDEITLLDESGEELLSPVTAIYPFFGDFALVNVDTRYGVIDKQGNYLFELQEPSGVRSWCFIGSRRNCIAVNIDTGEIGETLFSEIEEAEHGGTIEELSFVVTRASDGRKNIFDAGGGFFRVETWFEKIHIIDDTFAAGWDGERWITFPYMD